MDNIHNYSDATSKIDTLIDRSKVIASRLAIVILCTDNIYVYISETISIK